LYSVRMSDENKRIRFAELLELHLNNVVQQKFINESLTPNLMREIRASIRTTIDSVFTASKYKIGPNARAWLTDQFFKSIKFNGGEMMADQVIIHEYKLSDLPYNDVQLLKNLFNETVMGPLLEEEFRRRSAS